MALNLLFGWTPVRQREVSGVRIAIMQPYLLPYPGYFRLMSGVDAFVFLDDVQFPRRGWVHRNRLRRADGTPDWLTLPLRPAPSTTRIDALAFHPAVASLWQERLRRFSACMRPNEHTAEIVAMLPRLGAAPSEYIRGVLRSTAAILGLSPSFLRASDLPLPPTGNATERLIAICRQLGADRYVNAPNGRQLYSVETFASHGIRLEFLPDYRGEGLSILQSLHDRPPAQVRREIDANLS